MTRFLALILVVAVSTFAANKKLKGAIVANLNDRPTIQATPDSSGGQTDTLFISGPNPQNSRDSVSTTSVFNSIRNAYNWDGMVSPSSVIAKNPDSVVCVFIANRVDADTSDISFGILFRVSPTLWSLYGGTAGTSGTAVAPTKYRVAAPWVAGKGFRAYFVTTTATDTNRVRFAECSDKVNP